MKRTRRTRFAIAKMQAALAQTQPALRNLVATRISTFPKRFEGLRDRLVEQAGLSLASVENRLFSLLQTYPWWFGQTPSADAQHHANQQQYSARRLAKRSKQTVAATVPAKTSLTNPQKDDQFHA